MAVVGSAGMFHFRKSFSKRGDRAAKARPRRAARARVARVEEPDSSDDEGLP